MNTGKITIEQAIILLNVQANYSKEELKKAYRKQSLVYHPDKPTGDATKFIIIKEAYDLLLQNTVNPLLRHEHVIKIRQPQFTINKVDKSGDSYIFNISLMNIKDLIVGNINGIHIKFDVISIFKLNHKISCNITLKISEIDKIGYDMNFSIKGADNLYYTKGYKLEKPKFYERWF